MVKFNCIIQISYKSFKLSECPNNNNSDQFNKNENMETYSHRSVINSIIYKYYTTFVSWTCKIKY